MPYNQEKKPTVVVFRRWKADGSVIALFPYEKELKGLVSSFMHHGQHCPADYYGITHKDVSSAASVLTDQDVRDLCEELTSAPYFYHLKPLRHKDIVAGRK